ncbi:MAG: serine/threonine-protein kinase [Dokdonella sp.]
MPIDINDLRTGGALQGSVAASLLRAHDALAELSSGARIGTYRVVRELGRGGMAIVYLAERADGEYEQQVALKWMLQARPDATSEALFRRERQSLADLRHPHIARLLDGGRTDEGRPWFAMELIEGERLDLHCVQHALPQKQRLALFTQVCAAVAFAHARGVIHRDIKPSNVLVDADGSAKLLDFGIAQLLGQEDSLATNAYTPGFASPEQVHGEPLTVASDVYQLGRLLASLLSRDEVEQDTILLRTGAVAPEEAGEPAFPADIPADLQAILRKSTATDASRRYATAEALVDDIAAFIDHRPVHARPRSATYVAGRYLQRHPLGTGAAALAVAVLVGAIATFTWRLRVERDAATYQANAATAVLDFLNQDLLDAANPMHRIPNAPDMTVREALKVAEGSVDRRFSSQPEMAVSVLTTLAELQYQFGDFDAAKSLLDRATGWRGFRADSVEGLRARAKRGMVLTTTNRFDEADALLTQVVADAERTLGRNHRETLEHTLRLVENAERRQPDMSTAPRLAELRRRANAALGEPNTIAGEADYLISDDARMLGTPLLGAIEAKRALATLTAVYGPDHPATLKAKVTVASVLFVEGDVDGAIESLRQAHASEVSRYGPDVLDALYMQNELGLQLIFAERYAQARAVLVDLLARRERVQGAMSAQLIPSLSNLGNIHLREGHPTEALAAFERCAKIVSASPDTPAYMMASAHRGQADALRLLGRLDEAARALDAGDAAASALTSDDLRRATLRGSRAQLLIARGQSTEGVALLDATIAAMRDQVHDTHPYLKPLLAARAALASASSPD